MPPVEEVYAQNLLLKEENLRLRTQIEWFKKQLFGGGKSERQDSLQMLLKLEELEAQLSKQEESASEQVSYERRKSVGKRLSAEEKFAHVPVKETVEVIPEEVQADPQAYERIGEEKTFELDIIPPQVFKREIIRPKYRHITRRDLPPLVAPAPKRAVEGGFASAGLLSWVMLAKYLDHLPLYRQEKQFSRWSIPLSRQTLCDWVQVVAEWLQPIYGLMRQQLLENGYVQADETPVRFQDPDEQNGKTSQGYLWVISQPDGDVVFDWRLSRAHKEATSLLKGFKGVLQSDGYQAYQNLANEQQQIIRVGCWAHARRYFVEAMRTNPLQAGFVLRLIGNLYHLENQWNEQGYQQPEQKAHLRKRDFKPTLSLLQKTAHKLLQRYRPTSSLGKAAAYLINQWQALSNHLRFGYTRLDNNMVENAIRPSVIGRKNWLFIGSPQAGKATAIIYSIIVSCQRHDIDPFQYIKHLLTVLPAMNNQHDLDQLTPARYKTTLST